MNRLARFLFVFTWIVLILVIVFLAIVAGQPKQQQSVVNYIVKTDPTQGAEGLSAYQVALRQGFVGTESEWIDSLQVNDGRDGKDGVNAISTNTVTNTVKEIHTVEQVPLLGESAYDIWVKQGNIGSEADFLLSLKGQDGATPTVSIRLNKDSGNLEVKTGLETVWKVIPSCGGNSGKACK